MDTQLQSLQLRPTPLHSIKALLKSSLLQALLFSGAGLLLVSCSENKVPRIGADQPASFSPGEFEASSFFENSCQQPRANSPDRQGLLNHELHWLRSWTDETYLWFDEIVDQDPAAFDDPRRYFSTRRTDRTDSRGVAVDRFSFSELTPVWQAFIERGSSLGYGARFVQTRLNSPRQIRVALVQADSPAAQAGIVRGDSVLAVDGLLLSELSTAEEFARFNQGLFNPQQGQSHTLTIRTIQGQERDLELEGADVAFDAVPVTTVFTQNQQRVGYVLFNTHNRLAEAALFEAITELRQANVNELIVDLRYNGGGFLNIASQLAGMIAGDVARGRVFERTVFNSKLVDRHPDTGQPVAPVLFSHDSIGFSVDAGLALPILNLKRVVVLTSAATASASEAIMNGLRGIDIEVIQVGTTTSGKPYGFFGRDNCNVTYFAVQFEGQNDKGFSDFAAGFAPINAPSSVATNALLPGCWVQDDLDHALADPNEALLAHALAYVETGQCASATVQGKPNTVLTTTLDNDKPDYQLVQPLYESIKVY